VPLSMTLYVRKYYVACQRRFNVSFAKLSSMFPPGDHESQSLLDERDSKINYAVYLLYLRHRSASNNRFAPLAFLSSRERVGAFMVASQHIFLFHLVDPYDPIF